MMSHDNCAEDDYGNAEDDDGYADDDDGFADDADGYADDDDGYPVMMTAMLMMMTAMLMMMTVLLTINESAQARWGEGVSNCGRDDDWPARYRRHLLSLLPALDQTSSGTVPAPFLTTQSCALRLSFCSIDGKTQLAR